MSKINSLLVCDAEKHSRSQSGPCYCFPRRWGDWAESTISGVCHYFVDSVSFLLKDYCAGSRNDTKLLRFKMLRKSVKSGAFVPWEGRGSLNSDLAFAIAITRKDYSSLSFSSLFIQRQSIVCCYFPRSRCSLQPVMWGVQGKQGLGAAL